MYEGFFKLRKKPFDLVPDPEFIYLSASHKKALTYLDYGIRERAGFILLTGEVGSGKTTLIRDLIQRQYDRVVLAKVFNTKVDSQQLIAMINDDFGLEVQGRDKVTLVRELNEFLVGQFAAGNNPILIIDEAQNLGVELLEEVRMLSNLETAQKKLLQIVLVGQPELRQILAMPELMQLRQRISINCHLKALSREELQGYIRHRMMIAGNASAVTFTDASLDLLHGHSRGIPRLINIFCDFVMLTAFADGTTTITHTLVSEVIGELDFERTFWGEAHSVSTESGEDASAPGAPAALEGHPFLQGVAQRLDRLEGAIGQQQDPEPWHKLLQGLDALKNELSAQMTRHEGELNELRKKVELFAAAEAPATLHPVSPPPETSGFARRFVQGICGYGGKR